MTTTPQFASTPIFGGNAVTVTGSNITNPYATTTAGGLSATPIAIYTAPSGGARIDEVTIVGRGTTAANTVILYVNTGSNYYVIRSIAVPQTTISATVAPYAQTLTFDNLFLPSTYVLAAGLYAIDTTGFTVSAFGGSF